MSDIESVLHALTYNPAYRMQCQLQLQSGRCIILQELHQEMIYAGLLAGMPDHRRNQSLLEHAIKKACSYHYHTYLIEPRRRDYAIEPGDMRTFLERRPDRIPEWMPGVVCTGVFTSPKAVRDNTKNASALTVVWLQDEFALPIQESALSRILAIDWDTVAGDFDHND